MSIHINMYVYICILIYIYIYENRQSLSLFSLHVCVRMYTHENVLSPALSLSVSPLLHLNGSARRAVQRWSVYGIFVTETLQPIISQRVGTCLLILSDLRPCSRLRSKSAILDILVSYMLCKLEEPCYILALVSV